jgi:hypothetical protein
MFEYVFFKFRVFQGKQSLKQRIFYAIRAAMETNAKFENLYLNLSRHTKLGQALVKKYRIDFYEKQLYHQD